MKQLPSRLLMLAITFGNARTAAARRTVAWSTGASVADVQQDLASAASPTCPNGVCPGLGNIFFLPNVNVRKLATGGRSFLRNRVLGECTTLSRVEQNSREFQEADSMHKLVSQTSTTVGLDASYKTAALNVKGSVSAMTGLKSDHETTFHSTFLDITAITHVADLNQDTECLGEDKNIDAGFLRRFQALEEISPYRAAESSSWAPYSNFLRDQGSHIMIQQQIGSRFQQWESSTSESEDASSMLKAKTCADVEGTLMGGGWSVRGCAAYSKDTKEKALSLSSASYRIMLGGTLEARKGLVKKLTEDSLNAFIDSAEHGDQPVGYSFKPIWEVLITHYSVRCSLNGRESEDCQHLQRAYNLQAAYEGWLAVGCPKLTTANGKVYQQMAVADRGARIKTYQCETVKTGCMDDDDCHLGGAGSVCYCYGPSCMKRGERIKGTNQFRNAIQGSKTDQSAYEGESNSCYYKFIAHCNCDTLWSDGMRARNLYTQGTFY